MTTQEELEYLRKVEKSQEKIIMRLLREREKPTMDKNECKMLSIRFNELVAERNELDVQLQIAQNTILALRERKSYPQEEDTEEPMWGKITMGIIPRNY